MTSVQIVLVDPLYEGNIGLIARAMKNFGFSRLVLINPPPLGDKAKARASHAQDILSTARNATLEEVIAESSLLIATTGGLSKSVSSVMRMPYYTPPEIRENISGIDGVVSVLFGRENWGLSNEEIALCDQICTIPTAPEYPIVNISHAVALICCELAALPRGEYPLATRIEMDSFYEHCERFLCRIEDPDHKRQNTMIMLRRIFSRTQLTPKEVTTLHGLMRRTEWHLDNKDDELKYPASERS